MRAAKATRSILGISTERPTERCSLPFRTPTGIQPYGPRQREGNSGICDLPSRLASWPAAVFEAHTPAAGRDAAVPKRLFRRRSCSSMKSNIPRRCGTHRHSVGTETAQSDLLATRAEQRAPHPRSRLRAADRMLHSERAAQMTVGTATWEGRSFQTRTRLAPRQNVLATDQTRRNMRQNVAERRDGRTDDGFQPQTVLAAAASRRHKQSIDKVRLRKGRIAEEADLARSRKDAARPEEAEGSGKQQTRE